MAKNELLSVIGKQVRDGADAGMIPHMNYWQPNGEPLYGVADHSIISQPPLIAVAAELVYENPLDLAFLEVIYTLSLLHHSKFFGSHEETNL